MLFLTEHKRNFFRVCIVFCLPTNTVLAGAQTQQKQKIMDLVAISCSRFMSDASKRPSIQRDYLAWSQDYMSVILITRPGTINNGIDLAPPTFPLLKQLEFLRDFCTKLHDQNFPKAVDHLYKRLHQEISS